MQLTAAVGVPATGTSEGSIVVFDLSCNCGELGKIADAEGAEAAVVVVAAAAAVAADHSTAATEQAAARDEARRADCWLDEKYTLVDFAHRNIHPGLEALGLLVEGAEEQDSSLVFVYCFSKLGGSLSEAAGLTVGETGPRSPVGTRTARVLCWNNSADFAYAEEGCDRAALYPREVGCPYHRHHHRPSLAGQ